LPKSSPFKGKEIGHTKTPPSLQLTLVDYAIIMMIGSILAGDEPRPCGAYAGKRIKEAE
jgi:hypothetical protein